MPSGGETSGPSRPRSSLGPEGCSDEESGDAIMEEGEPARRSREEGYPDEESGPVPSSLAHVIAPILRVADEIEEENPRVAYLCRFAAWKKVDAMDREVQRFKTQLTRRLEKDVETPRRLASTDAKEIQKFYQQYGRKNLEEDLLTKNRDGMAGCYQIASVLYDVLKIVDSGRNNHELDEYAKWVEKEKASFLYPEGPSSSSDSSCKLQLKAYAKVDAEPPENRHGCMPVMVSITAPSVMTEQRAPVDLVILLHVRVDCKVPEKWKELLMEAVKVVARKLNERDRLAVIPSGGSRVSEDPERSRTVKYTETLLPMSTKNKELYYEAMNEAIEKCDNPLVRALESADSILHGQGYEDDEERREGYIIVISNSNEDMGSLLTWRCYSVLAVGFRDACNARTMHTIARSRDSAYTVLDDEHGRVTQAFAASVDRVISAVTAKPVEVKLKCHHKVFLSAIDAPHVSYFISYDKEEIWASAHLSGVVTNFIIYLGLRDLRDVVHNDLTNVFTVLHVKYRHLPEKLHGEVVTVRKGVNGSKEVVAEMVRIKGLKAVTTVAKIIQKDKNDSEQLHEAADMLHTQWADLENSYRDSEAADLISGLVAEMKEMEIRLYNNYLWLEYMLSWKSHQWWRLPLPRLFMDKQAADDPLLRLTILAKADGMTPGTTVTDCQQQRLPVKVPVLVRVMAPEVGLAKEKRAPVDLVIVLDASHGVRELEKKTKRRMEQLIEATKLVMEKLSHKDRLAIVPVQSSVAGHAAGLSEMCKEGRSEATGLLEMCKEGRSEIFTKVKSLVVSKLPTASANKAAQTSHWRAHWREQPKWLHVAPVNSSIPTSASPESRITASTTAQPVEEDGGNILWNALMDAIKILNDRTAKDRLGFIIVISDSDDVSICQKSLDPEYTIHAFSFYNSGTRNARVMHYIASSSSGIYASLQDHRNQITKAFTACINQITSILGVQTKVDIRCSRSSGIALSAIESGKFRSPIDDDRKSGSIFSGALYAGTTKNFMLYVDNVHEEDNLSKLIAVRVEWLHAFTGAEEKLDGQVDIVRDGSGGSEEVMAYIARAEAGRIVGEIADPSYDTVVLADRLGSKCLEASEKAGAAGDDLLAREMEKMEALLHRKVEQMTTMEKIAVLRGKKTVDLSYVKKLVEDRLSYMLSWLSFQALCERAPSLP